MSALPVTYPKIPYLGALNGPLHHGRMIRISGEALHHDWIRIDIRTGAVIEPSDDINLHLSIRPNENLFVRNHMARREWGHEERTGGCPIKYGQKFEILILAEMEQFKIAVNGYHFCEFRHRIPLSTARFIYVAGQIKIYSIKVEGDPQSMIPSAPTLPAMTMPAPALSYHQPQYQPPYQPPPPHHHQPHHHPPPHMPYAQPSPYGGSMSSTITAVPSNQAPQTYPSGQYYSPPQQTYSAYQQPQTLSSLPYQQYPSYHTYHTQSYTPQKSGSGGSGGSKALKYAAGIGAAGLGAYAITKMFDSDSSNSSD